MTWTVLDPTPVGPLHLTAAGDALTGLRFGSGPAAGDRADDDPVLVSAVEQLAEYFAGERRSFTVALAPVGTSFQRAVWEQLRLIPYGTTVSYGELARRVGDAGAARAVGLANGRNPIAIVVPCHRVIGADGSLTGFGGGMAAKRALLDLEAGTLF
ncbi:MAG: methylated-DNA-[protein]-cysteine S-methyltransferase [Frankiaceae bacterium]|jgi:methylated-DNA-[protein]-cysteine S-methyltransferase|nr:methylated-DNA-[protein]-cysteine S-methyltransferase [Frankiaceae bacterium]